MPKFPVNLSTMDVTAHLELVLILLVAVVGKCAGTFAAAKAVHVPTRQAAVLATVRR